MTVFGFTGRSLLACWFTAHNEWRSLHILCLSVNKSMLTMVSVTSVAIQGLRSRCVLFVKHLALEWQGTTDFQEPVARAAAPHHAFQEASSPFSPAPTGIITGHLDDVLTGISVLAWRFLAKDRCQCKNQHLQLTIIKKGSFK